MSIKSEITKNTLKQYAETLKYSTAQFIQLALQEMVDRDNLGVIIEVVQKRKKAA